MRDGPAARGGGPGPPSRRAMLAGAGLLGVTAGGAGFLAGDRQRGGGAASPAGEPGEIVPFHGAHQAGIATPAQDRLAFGALNIAPGATRADLRDLLREWTVAAARMTRGEPAGQTARPQVPPLDTGEAASSPAARLTITIGYGPGLFGRPGLAGKKPAALAPLPPLPGENLDPGRSGGDLCVQACSDDPLVAFHAVRNLARLGMGVVEHAWMELGFGRTSTTTAGQPTPRNLMGFKDGTRNIKAGQAGLMRDHVWVGAETDQPWLRGGSYLVARRIRMFIENWDRDYLQDQQRVIGRDKASGAPLSGGTEFTPPDFAATAAAAEPVIPATAHIRLASPEHNGGTRILRRGYSYTDGIDPRTGTLQAGLFFVAFMKDPGQFARIQRSLAGDALGEYIQHTSSAVFACPPGLHPGQHWGEALFG